MSIVKEKANKQIIGNLSIKNSKCLITNSKKDNPQSVSAKAIQE